MGMTEVQSYFTQIIGHNSMIVNWIPTKLVTEISVNQSFRHAKLQLDHSTCLYFMADFAKFRKE